MTNIPQSATLARTTSCVCGKQCCSGRKLVRCLSRPTPKSMVQTFFCSNTSLVMVLSKKKKIPFFPPGDAVELVEYESSAAGLICSFIDRFQDDVEKLESDLLEMSQNDAPCWCS